MTASHGYLNIVDKSDHRGELTMETVQKHTENFAKPAVFRQMVPVDPRLSTRAFFAELPDETMQWRQKTGEAPVAFRSDDGKTDYNYVTGKVGKASEFLEELFVRELDVYAHLGTISSGYRDPYEWGRHAFEAVKTSIFRGDWFKIPNWQITGHMFLGRSNQEYGEPSRGAVGSDWHMFPTLNVFVMIVGRKKWMTHPPAPQEQFDGDARMFATSSGREAPGEDFAKYDTVYLDPGDVLVNVPYEWHKVLNMRGPSLGAAFRIIDTEYIAGLARRPSLKSNLPDFADVVPEDVAHLLSSLRYASLHLPRAQMMLNDAEHIYPVLLKLLRMPRAKMRELLAEDKKLIAVVD